MDQNRAGFTDPSNDEPDEEVVVSGDDVDIEEKPAVSASEVTPAQQFRKVQGLPGVGGHEDQNRP